MMFRPARIINRSFSRLSVKGPHPNLADFIAQTKPSENATAAPLPAGSPAHKVDRGLKIYIETYGCQMNLSDSEIVRSILSESGHVTCKSELEADVILTNTCAIRENAEDKVWARLQYFHSLRKKNRAKTIKSLYPIVGVLGCMAERLKDKLLLEESVDFVCGPDAYRDMPRLLENIVSAGQKEANTVLSMEETYADINPVREVNGSSAFVSIMRGCNNMCSFCIVPFTRGRERSRPMSSIMKEVQTLTANGVKEIVLLGQNVNGYHDNSDESAEQYPTTTYKATPGFNNLYQSRKRDIPGARFADLLRTLADSHPEMRIRFTSPHPKDFPEEVLSVVSEKDNVCAAVHLPVQSGSSNVLQRMRRGYTREAYLSLVQRTRDMIPGVCISTDIITGFCDETEEEHQESLSLMREVGFDQAFMYAYSMREKTHANRTMEDNVPEEVKQRRLSEIIEAFRESLLPKNHAEEHGRLRLVLVEEEASKSSDARPMLTGRTDGNKRVVFPATSVLRLPAGLALQMAQQRAAGNREGDCVVRADLAEEKNLSLSVSDLLFDHASAAAVKDADSAPYTTNGMRIHPDSAAASALDVVEGKSLVGQYVLVRVVKSFTSTLKGYAVAVSSIKEYSEIKSYL